MRTTRTKRRHRQKDVDEFLFSFEGEKEFYNKTPSHNTGHGTGAHWH